MYNLYLTDVISGTEYSNQRDFSIPLDLEHTFSLNTESKVYTITLQNSIDIYGDTFQVLWDMYKQGFTRVYEAIIKKKIENDYVTIFNGRFLISDATFFPLENKCTIQLTSNDWQFYIDSGWKMKVSLDSEETRNSTEGAKITMLQCPQVSLGNFTLYDKSNSYTPTTFGSIVCYDIKNVLAHIVTYISDTNITFASTWYDTLDVAQKCAITTGLNFRTGGSSVPLVSLEEVYKHIRNIFNVYLFFEVDSSGNKILRLETPEYIENNQYRIDGLDIQTISISVDQSYLYSTVKSGSTSSIDNNTKIQDSYCFPIVRGNSFAVETFNIQNEVSVRNELDITLDWIIDHNVLEDMRIYGNEDYDEDIVLINYNSDTIAPIKSDIFNIAQTSNNDGFYNEFFVNSQIVQRRTDIYGSIVLHFLDSDDKFIAYGDTGHVDTWTLNTWSAGTHTSGILSTQITAPVQFKNDSTTCTPYLLGGTATGSDANNLYGNSTTTPVSQANSYYTVPNSGVYTFRADVYFYCLAYLYSENKGRIYLQLCKGSYGSPTVLGQEVYFFYYDKSNASDFYLYRDFDTHYNYQEGDPFTFSPLDSTAVIPFGFYGRITRSLYLDATDNVWVRVVFEETDANDSTAYPTSFYQNLAGFNFSYKQIFFDCPKAINGGNTYLLQNNGSPDVYLCEYQSWIPDRDILRILNASATNSVVSLGTNGRFYGTNESLVINHKDNICKFVTRTRKIT